MLVSHDTLYSFSSVSQIIPADKKLLQETIQRIRPDSKNYEDSWGYIIQATRYNGFKWYDSQTGSLIFFGRKSDTDPTLVVPLFFAEPEYLRDVVDKVQGVLKAPQTTLKNVNPGDVEKFLPYGFRPYKENEGWCAEARFDDQTYPQLIIDLKKITEAKGRKYHKLRKALNKKPHVVCRKYRETDKDDVLEIFALKDGNTKDTPEKAKGMYFASHVMYPTADVNKFVFTDGITGEIIGFIATSDISSRTTAFIASLFRPDAIKVRTWCTYQIFVKKYHEGFELATLGGCETGNTYHFKRRTLQPVEELEKTHLVYTS